jgi:hypothetical protein
MNVCVFIIFAIVMLLRDFEPYEIYFIIIYVYYFKFSRRY